MSNPRYGSKRFGFLEYQEWRPFHECLRYMLPPTPDHERAWEELYGPNYPGAEEYNFFRNLARRSFRKWQHWDDAMEKEWSEGKQERQRYAWLMHDLLSDLEMKLKKDAPTREQHLDQLATQEIAWAIRKGFDYSDENDPDGGTGVNWGYAARILARIDGRAHEIADERRAMEKQQVERKRLLAAVSQRFETMRSICPDRSLTAVAWASAFQSARFDTFNAPGIEKAIYEHLLGKYVLRERSTETTQLEKQLGDRELPDVPIADLTDADIDMVVPCLRNGKLRKTEPASAPAESKVLWRVLIMMLSTDPDWWKTYPIRLINKLLEAYDWKYAPAREAMWRIEQTAKRVMKQIPPRQWRGLVLWAESYGN